MYLFALEISKIYLPKHDSVCENDFFGKEENCNILIYHELQDSLLKKWD